MGSILKRHATARRVLAASGVLSIGTVVWLAMDTMAARTPAQRTNTQLAITLDDLPWVGPLPEGDSANQALDRIAAVLRVHGVPATGFVIGDHAVQDEQPIHTWVQWGLTIGNHSASHLDLNRMEVEEWLADIARGHQYLSKFGSAYVPYFRFPMLHQGNTADKRARVHATLEDLELRIAHVTIDNSEWILARAHATALASRDAVLRHAVGREFIRHILAALEHADGVARRKFGRSVPQVLLLHANTLVEDKLDELLLDLAARGVEFVTLQQALADPVYSHPDDYTGSKGLSWLYRARPLTVEDVQWDDAEAAAIEQRFATALSRDVVDSPASRISSQYLSNDAPKEMSAIFAEAAESERMRSLLVMHQGELVAEAYFNGAGQETAQNLKSVTKSLASSLVGVALRKGWIESVDDPVRRYLPGPFETHAGKAGITIRQLLTMSSGLQPVSYGAIQQSSDWVGMLLAQPWNEDRVGTFVYDTPVLQLLTALLKEVSGMSVSELAQRELFSPLGGEMVHWRVDSQSIELGGNDAYVRPRDLIRLGELYRLGGSLEGLRILPQDFVQASTSIQIEPSSETVNHDTLRVRGYGYLWWLLDLNGQAAYAALGHGGQILLVSPQRELVVLMTSRWPSASSVPHYHHLTRILVEGTLPLFPSEQLEH